MIKRIDLHTHSNVSDGTMTPTELVIYAKEKGLSAISLTDHDTINGLKEAGEVAAKIGIEFINGIELSAGYKEQEIHLLGLFIDYNSEYLQDKLNCVKNNREKRNIQMIKKLNDANINITLDDVRGIKGSTVTRANFANAIVSKGYAENFDEAFKKFLKNKLKGYVPKEYFPPSESINMVRKSGGLSFLAHPFLYKLDETEIEQLILELKGYRLNGIEVYHATHSQDNIDFLLKMTKKYDLIISGGSDFHGKNKANINIGVGRGNLCIPYELLDNIKKYL